MALLSRHVNALRYVLGVIVPLILRTGKRPVIFARHSGMGDIICSIPAARELMKRHPGATFIYNCHPDFASVPMLAGIADLITSYEPIGLIGHWYRFLLAGCYGFGYGLDTPGETAKEPIIREFLRKFDLPLSDEHPHLSAGPEARERVRKLLAQKNLDASSLVLIHPGPSWAIKEWPHQNWRLLVAELKKRGFTSIAQLGVGRYMTTGKVAVETIPGAVSLVDELSIEECIAVIEMAKLLIGIDSGLLHIAVATRTPSVGLWGATSPQFLYAEDVRKHFVVSKVECAGCYHRLPHLHWFTGCPYDIKCMSSIQVEEVLRAVFSHKGLQNQAFPAAASTNPTSGLSSRG